MTNIFTIPSPTTRDPLFAAGSRRDVSHEGAGPAIGAWNAQVGLAADNGWPDDPEGFPYTPLATEPESLHVADATEARETPSDPQPLTAPTFQVERQTHRPGWWDQFWNGLPEKYDTVTTHVRDGQGRHVLEVSADEFDGGRDIHLRADNGVEFSLSSTGLLIFPDRKNDVRLHPGVQVKVGDAIVKPLFRDDAENVGTVSRRYKDNAFVVGLEVHMDGKKLTYKAMDGDKPAALYGAYRPTIEALDPDETPPAPHWDEDENGLIADPELIVGHDGLYLAPQLGRRGGRIEVESYYDLPEGLVRVDNRVLADPDRVDESKRPPGA